MLGVLLATSCAHKPRADAGKTTDSRVAQAREIARAIVPCRTTESDLRRSLGAPTRDGILHRQRIISWIVADQGAVKYLAVSVNARGIVTDVYWDVPTEIPWTPQDLCDSH